jgi:2-polyprenyl-6-methoxyphenol hydroxylase-like FAD-dependent oxidoreductase
MQKVTCIAVGGGPAGMILGLLLARAGVEVTVHGDFHRDFRGDTVHPTTIELLDDLGLGEQFARLPQNRLEEVLVPVADGIQRVGDLRKLPGKYKYVAMVPQWDFLNLPDDAARREPTFTLQMNTEAVGLITDRGKVLGVEYRTAQGERGQICSALTVGCDGRNSVVRAVAGLVAKSSPTPMDVWWFCLPRAGSIRRRCSPWSPLVARTS